MVKFSVYLNRHVFVIFLTDHVLILIKVPITTTADDILKISCFFCFFFRENKVWYFLCVDDSQEMSSFFFSENSVKNEKKKKKKKKKKSVKTVHCYKFGRHFMNLHKNLNHNRLVWNEIFQCLYLSWHQYLFTADAQRMKRTLMQFADIYYSALILLADNVDREQPARIGSALSANCTRVLFVRCASILLDTWDRTADFSASHNHCYRTDPNYLDPINLYCTYSIKNEQIIWLPEDVFNH